MAIKFERGEDPKVYTINEVFEREPQWYMIVWGDYMITPELMNKEKIKEGKEKLRDEFSQFCNPDELGFVPVTEEFVHYFKMHEFYQK